MVYMCWLLFCVVGCLVLAFAGFCLLLIVLFLFCLFDVCVCCLMGVPVGCKSLCVVCLLLL